MVTLFAVFHESSIMSMLPVMFDPAVFDDGSHGALNVRSILFSHSAVHVR